jgi:drug/metabolite transporter (DMT)-like permease
MFVAQACHIRLGNLVLGSRIPLSQEPNMSNQHAANAPLGALGPWGEKRNLYLGVGSGLLVVLCWASWIVATRFGVTTHLTPFDIAFLRYVVASAILAPVLLLRGFGVRQIGLWRTLVLVSGAGLPYLLIGSTGMTFAPASDSGAVTVGTMPVFVAVLSALTDNEKFDATRVVGFVAVTVGIIGIAAHGLFHIESGAWRGHVLFLASAALFAIYTVTFRHSGIGPWHAAAIVNFYSLVIFAPVYFLASGAHLLAQAPSEVMVQAVMQGVVSAIAALFFYGDAVRRLGASRAAVLSSFTPVVAALLAMPLLGEFPTRLTWAAIIVVSVGVVLASGGFSRKS